MSIQSKSILISGGLGFIGRHLIEALKQNNSITVIDNLSSSRFSQIEGVNILVGNVNDQLDQLSAHNFDIFYHLGEYARVEQSINNFESCMRSNFGPVARVLEFCSKSDIKLIYAGSSTKFAIGCDGKLLSPYTWSKTINTDLIQQYANWYKLNYAICYFYNVYGDGELDVGEFSTVVGRFIRAKQTGKIAEITYPGTQLRNFTHINDTVNALISIGAHGSGDNYCIANEKSYSILELAELLDLEYVMQEPHSANRMGAGFDLTKMKTLGWCAKIELKDYLNSIMDRNSGSGH